MGTTPGRTGATRPCCLQIVPVFPDPQTHGDALLLSQACSETPTAPRPSVTLSPGSGHHRATGHSPRPPPAARAAVLVPGSSHDGLTSRRTPDASRLRLAWGSPLRRPFGSQQNRRFGVRREQTGRMGSPALPPGRDPDIPGHGQPDSGPRADAPRQAPFPAHFYLHRKGDGVPVGVAPANLRPRGAKSRGTRGQGRGRPCRWPCRAGVPGLTAER